jgi:hypothetical protein
MLHASARAYSSTLRISNAGSAFDRNRPIAGYRFAADRRTVYEQPADEQAKKNSSIRKARRRAE